MGPTLYVGTDISEATNRTRFLDPGGTEVGRGFTSANDLPGSQLLAEEVLRRARAIGATEIRWGLEATNLFWWHLATYLTTHPDLLTAGLKVWVFNPRQVASFKDAYGDLGKGDWVDAGVIADRLRFGRLPAECYLDERYQPLQRLTRHRRHLVKTLVREKQVALGYVYLKLSAYHLTRPLADTFGVTSQVLLTDYLTPDEVVQAPLEELAGLIARESRGTVADPGEDGGAGEPGAVVLARHDPDAHRPDQAAGQGHRRRAEGRARPDGGHRPRARSRLHRRHHRRTRRRPPVRRRGGGGQVRRPHVAPVPVGGVRGRGPPAHQDGNAYLRYYLIEGANSVRLRCPEFRSYYDRKFREVTRHQHRRALVLTARKLVRLIDPLLRSGQIYRPPSARKAS